MGKRLEAALRLRDAALKKLRSAGAFVEQEFGRTFDVQTKGLDIAHRTPFQKLPPVPPDLKYRAALLGERAENPGYGLDIWDRARGRKVLNIEWSAAGDVELVSFCRGPWEAGVLAFASVANNRPNYENSVGGPD